MPICRNHGELSEEAFSKRATGYIPPICRECERAIARANRKKRYHDPATAELIRSQNKIWRDANSDYLSQKLRDRYVNDLEFRQKVKERTGAYRTDPDAHALKKIRAAKYFQENKSSIYLRLKERQAKNPALKLRGAIRSRVWETLKHTKNGVSVLKYLPYSIQDLRSHLESQFEEWMDWKNWGVYDPHKPTWQIDHVIPQCMFPFQSMNDDNFLLCWSLDNLRPLRSNQNFLEGNRKSLFSHYSTFHEYVKFIRDEGFFGDEESSDEVFNKLSKSVVGDDSLPQPNVGLRYLDRIFIHRFDSSTTGLRSFNEYWNDDLDMLRAISYIIKENRVPTANLIASNIKFSSFLPSHFFPSAAAALVRKYACGGDIVDPFLGWGGRVLGSICGGAKSICGTDLQKESVSGSERLVSDFSKYNRMDSEFLNVNFSEYLMSTSRKFDLLVTSPPFLNTEDYGVGNYSGIRGWSESIVQPLIQGALRVIRQGGHVAIHGEDRKNVPVLTTLLTALNASGMEKVAEYKYGKTAGQSVVVFRRV